MNDITHVLQRIESGESLASNELLPLVYDNLRQLAARELQREPSGLTLQPTALVNEAWLKLARGENVKVGGRDHFLCLAGRVMRQVLVDHARTRRSEKRGEGWRRVTLVESGETPITEEADMLDVDEALQKLAGLSELQAQLIELRFFAGSSMAEAAEALGISLSDAERKWRMARSWLAVELREV